MEYFTLRFGLICLISVSAQEEEPDPLAEPWEDNCETLDPGNHSTPQESPSPFLLTLGRKSMTTEQGLYLTLQAPSFPPPQRTFTGFMIQGRDDQTGEAVGEFDTQFKGVKIFNCFARFHNTAAHEDLNPKTSVRLRWAPDSDLPHSVTFYFTVAETTEPKMIYWRYQKAGTVQITKAL